ncbi:MAG: hypothetical protein K8T89_09710 [Planctomycetes bacterium]|nr:hypothetical protein [Planctomycetota bacterium]
MAHFIDPGYVLENVYQGVRNIFEYTNGDGDLVPFNCGQAAAATFLTFHGVHPPVEDQDQANDLMCRLEEEHPPDNMAGYFGTSRRRVERICRSAGMRVHAIAGEKKLRETLSQKKPVIVMLGLPGPKLFNRWTLPSGHWMVAYGYDEENIFLTNHGKMPWPEFRRGWNALVPRLISMTNRGLAADV